MWFLEYVVYAEFKHLNGLLGRVYRALYEKTTKPDTSQDTKWTWLQMTEVWSMKLWNSKDLNRRCGSSHAKYLYPNHGENDVKDPYEVWQIFKKVREALWKRMGPNRAEKGLGRPAHADRPTPFWGRFVMPFDLDKLIYRPCLWRPPHPFIGEPPNWGIYTKGSRRRCESLTLPRRYLRLDHSHHGWTYVVKPWWSSEAMPWIQQGTHTFDGNINLILSILLM
jgi:hypothetical protein